ncbi:MAG TPA: phosphoribosylamine--glycine ligase [Fibrobacteria bacterium]|nr:phosphoribosylamine--glycine ligase [Fibrobacteria bacterium]
MKILIIGNGGREHAIGRKLAASPRKPTLIFAPGNPGMEELGSCFSVAPDDFRGLLSLAQTQKADLTIVGPEQPLVGGLVDLFEDNGLRVFGPNRAAAALEGSKAFSKDFMGRHGIPTAKYMTFRALEPARAHLREVGAPIVIKASGLAGGKGAVVCMTLPEAESALQSMLGPKAVFGPAGSEVVMEEFMEGEEASVFALTDGKSFVLLPTAQDHKRIGDGDTGPNTGGMGAYAPAPLMTRELLEEASRTIIIPTLDGMRREGTPYKGILYVGLMITPKGPKVVEYNCRLGDPETQVVLPILQEDLLELILASLEGNLDRIRVAPPAEWAAVVVLASKGYPGPYETGIPIAGLDQVQALPRSHAIHAGTKRMQGRLVSAGGRVLGMVGQGPTLQEAIQAAYEGVAKAEFPGGLFRKDIGKKGLARLVA